MTVGGGFKRISRQDKSHLTAFNARGQDRPAKPQESELYVYAIISDGGFQYRVQDGLEFEVQLRDLPADAKTIEFDRVLMVGDLPDGPQIGQPTVPGARVIASVMGEIKGDKQIIQKFARRKGYHLKKGHRQRYLRVRVDKIAI